MKNSLLYFRKSCLTRDFAIFTASSRTAASSRGIDNLFTLMWGTENERAPRHLSEMTQDIFVVQTV